MRLTSHLDIMNDNNYQYVCHRVTPYGEGMHEVSNELVKSLKCNTELDSHCLSVSTHIELYVFHDKV